MDYRQKTIESKFRLIFFIGLVNIVFGFVVMPFIVSLIGEKMWCALSSTGALNTAEESFQIFTGYIGIFERQWYILGMTGIVTIFLTGIHWFFFVQGKMEQMSNNCRKNIVYLLLLCLYSISIFQIFFGIFGHLQIYAHETSFRISINFVYDHIRDYRYYIDLFKYLYLFSCITGVVLFLKIPRFRTYQ